MIRSNKNIIYLLISLFTCVACTNETLVGPTVEEGVPVTATLSFQTTNPVKIETRATDISEDNKVNSLAIFIFKTTGEQVGDTHFCTSDELSNGSIKIKTSSGERCIYAVANYENSLFNLKSDLESVSSFSGLKHLSTKLLQTSISVLDGEFLMSGRVVPDEEAYDYESSKTTCTISPTGVVNGKIQLKHVMAAVNFKVKCTNNDATFIPSSWQVKKLPLYTNVFEQANDYQTGAAASYFSSKANVDFTKDEEGFDTFSFLMMENRKTPQGPAANRDEREKTSGTSTSAEDFIVANKNSTYLVLHGTYEGISGQTVNNVSGDKYVKAQVTYYIHLGLWQESGETDYGNFDIFRNNRYTYTVKVAGVDNLIVEVEKEGADNETWGGDGDMFLSAQSVRTFDAHFETTVISFQKQQILDLIDEYGAEGDLEMFKEKFLILAATPRNNFVSDETDLDWVTYRRNPENVTTFAKYKDTSDPNYGNPLDADGFKEDLFNAASDSHYEDTDSIRYTCFIDEYYYGDEKGNYNNSLPLEDFIDTKPRTIQICTYFKKNDQSPSTLSMAAYTFSQRSICTIFDPDYLKSNNGWGTEWSQEGENLPAKGELASKNQYYQGRTNTWSFVTSEYSKGKIWSSYINYENNNLVDDVKYAQYACLARNRDLNGNGTIDANELRWYLPSVKQYLGFVLGEDALPKDARLYNRSNLGSDSEYTYCTSSAYYAESGLKFYLLQAYEGASITYDQGNRYPYRCIRNLKNVAANTANYVKLSGAFSDATAQFYSFEGLNTKTKRNNVTGALTFGHNIFGEENRLPESFEVRSIIENRDGSVNAGLASSSNPCIKAVGDGWRIPNQRELAVIVYNRVSDDGMDVTRHYFSSTKSANGLYCGYNRLKTSMTTWEASTTTSDFRYGEEDRKFVGFHCIKDNK